MVLAGTAAALVGGVVAEVIAIALITLGLGAALLLVFLEVGLSEDRELAREEEGRRRRAAEKATAHRPRAIRRRWRRRPG
jgi:hypothetical protein